MSPGRWPPCTARCRSAGWWPTCGRPSPTPSWPTTCAPRLPTGWRCWPRPVPAVPTRTSGGDWPSSPTTAPAPPPTEPVPVSPSKVESFRRCELRWFLEHVGGGDTSGAAQSVGTLVHAVAESALTPETSTAEALRARLDSLLPTVDLGTGWAARKEREKAEGMVRRLATW